jgi:hypothetical protein
VPRINSLDGRLLGMMQALMAAAAQHHEFDEVAPRGVVEQQDALDAVLQLAAVIDSQMQSGRIAPDTGLHAAAMLMIVRDYIKPLPAEGDADIESVTEDLREKVAQLRVIGDEGDING